MIVKFDKILNKIRESDAWSGSVTSDWLLTNGKIVVGEWDSKITSSGVNIVTTIGSDNTTIPTSQAVKDAITNYWSVVYQGLWNATTNTPHLTSGTGTKGYQYVVNVAWATIIDGISQWNVGDQIIFNGTVWEKTDGIPNEVFSVAWRTWAVTLAQADISWLTTTSSPTFAWATLSWLSNGMLKSVSWVIEDAVSWTDYQAPITKWNLTEATSDVLTITGGTNAVIGSGASIEVKKATASQDWYLASGDFSTFDWKQDALTNPVTGTGTSWELASFTGSGTTSTVWSTYSVTTSIGSPGSDTNIPTEKAVRTAIWGAGGWTVTSVSVVTANWLGGTVANASSTPAITLTTWVSGMLKGNGTAISAATDGTDYLAPDQIGSTVQGYNSNTTLLWNTTTGTGSIVLATSPTFTGTVTVPTTVNATDAAQKYYVDAVAQWQSVKPSVIVATTTWLPTYTYHNGTLWVWATITWSSVGILTIDWHNILLWDLILVKNETSSNAPYNGQYICTTEGTAWAEYVLTRSVYMNNPNDFDWAFMFIESWTVNYSSWWTCTTTWTVVIGTTNIGFTQFSGAWEITASTGLTKTGNMLTIDSTVATLSGSQSLTNKDLTGISNTFPTFNQDTTGNAASATLAWNNLHFHGVAYRLTNAPLPTNITSTTFTLSTGTTPLVYYFDGVSALVSTNVSVTIGSSAWIYWIYFSDSAGTLAMSSSYPWLDYAHTLIATVNWNGSNYGIVNDERHAYDSPVEWHQWAHSTIGTRYKSGLNFSFAGTTISNTTFSISSGQIDDEDIQFVIGTQTTAITWYQTGASTYAFDTTASTTPYRNDGTGINAVNASWYALVRITAANRYFNYWVYGTTDVNKPIHIFCETTSTTWGYTSVNNALAVSPPNLSGNGFNLSPEYKLLYQVIVNGAGLVQTMTSAQDFRTTSTISGGSVSTISASAVSESNFWNVQTAINDIVTGTNLGTPTSLVGTNITGTAASLTAWSVTNATLTTALTVNTGAVTLIGNSSGSSITLWNWSSSVSWTNTWDQTNVSGSSGSCTGNSATATKLATARAINGVNFDWSAAISVPSYTWALVPGTPTYVSTTSFTITGDYHLIFNKGIILKWTESSALRKAAIAIPSTYSSGTWLTTITIFGDIMGSGGPDASSMNYNIAYGIEQFAKTFAIAWSIWTTGTNQANYIISMGSYYVLGSDMWVWTAGTWNSTTVYIQQNGGQYLTEPTLGSGISYTTTPKGPVSSLLSIALWDTIQLNVNMVQSTPAIDLYVLLYIVPTRIFSLS